MQGITLCHHRQKNTEARDSRRTAPFHFTGANIGNGQSSQPEHMHPSASSWTLSRVPREKTKKSCSSPNHPSTTHLSESHRSRGGVLAERGRGGTRGRRRCRCCRRPPRGSLHSVLLNDALDKLRLVVPGNTDGHQTRITREGKVSGSLSFRTKTLCAGRPPTDRLQKNVPDSYSNQNNKNWIFD